MLTKSKFKNFLSCKNEFWLDHHFPQPSSELSLNDQLRREAGYEVEGLARQLSIFLGEHDGNVEFGKEFISADLYAKADIVVTDGATGAIDIFEVKSGTKAKEEYQIDLTFQCVVAENAGFNINNAFLITLDNTYLFDGNLAIESLLRVSDETDYVNNNKAAIAVLAAEAVEALEQSEITPRLVDYCKTNKLDCRSIRKHHLNIPEYNVSHIFNAGTKKLNVLLEAGVLTITDIPADFQMTERESARVEVEKSQTSFIDQETIRRQIEGLQYPLNFLDYESFNPAVPKFVGTRAYQQMVFQYSLHTIDACGEDVRHSYHLSRNDGRHPTEEIVERLHEDLDGRVGTIIIWSEGFEKSRNTEMGEMYPHYADLLSEMNDRVYDLRKVFSQRHYMHPDFHGRDSIKKVLPVITDLSYAGMDIADGLTASIKWYHAAMGRGTPEERTKTFADLEDYCHLDTLAMVEIYKHLSAVCA